MSDSKNCYIYPFQIQWKRAKNVTKRKYQILPKKRKMKTGSARDCGKDEVDEAAKDDDKAETVCSNQLMENVSDFKPYKHKN